MINYSVKPLSVVENPSFREASKEELRVLLALIELDGCAKSISSLATASGISVARCKAAIAFWEESGVIVGSKEPTITEEFEERLLLGEIDEVPATEVADSIRDENLASMMDECAALLGCACLSNLDVKNLTALHTQYKLSPDYILTLAAYLATKNALTIRRLSNKAIQLCNRNIDNTELLEDYIRNLENSDGSEWEYRKVLGIYGRNLSKTEKEYFAKWANEFGYSEHIISEAYDIAVMNSKTGRGDLRYMDTVLTDWHNNGCKTVSDCVARSEQTKLEREAETAKRKSKTAKSKPEPPRYGDFDINDAFKKALERSYGADKKDKEG